MMCTVVCLKVVSEWQKIVHSRNNSRPPRPASPIESIVSLACWACHPPEKLCQCQGEPQGARARPFFLGPFFRNLAHLRLTLQCSHTDYFVKSNYGCICNNTILLAYYQAENFDELTHVWRNQGGIKSNGTPHCRPSLTGIWLTSALKAASAEEDGRVYSARCALDPSPVPSWLWNGSLAHNAVDNKLRFEIQATIASNVYWRRTSIMTNRYHLIYKTKWLPYARRCCCIQYYTF